jgi:RHS repeat-associated protein
MLQPCRGYNSGDYRYGYNRKENDNEIKGVGNHIDYGMRTYDPRIARFPSVDPITKNYPFLTPYQYASNNPILNVDIDGLEGLAGNMIPGMPGDANGDNKINSSEIKSGFIALGVVTAVAVVAMLAPEVAAASGESGWTMFSALMGDEAAAYGSYATGAGVATSYAVYENYGLEEATVSSEVKIAIENEAPVIVKAEEVTSDGLGYYSHLKDPKNVGPGKGFSQTQVKNIIKSNIERNGGVIKSDISNKTLDPAQKSMKGVPSNMNQAEVDHYIPKSLGGTNSYSNARVTSKAENLQERNNKCYIADEK